MHNNHHVVLTVPAIMHDNEPHVILGDTKFLSARILGERIGFAIAISHCDRLKRTGPFTRRRLDHEIDRYV
jgi:hypothetical protein